MKIPLTLWNGLSLRCANVLHRIGFLLLGGFLYMVAKSIHQVSIPALLSDIYGPTAVSYGSFLAALNMSVVGTVASLKNEREFDCRGVSLHRRIFQFSILPLLGSIADRFGRKVVLVRSINAMKITVLLRS